MGADISVAYIWVLCRALALRRHAHARALSPSKWHDVYARCATSRGCIFSGEAWWVPFCHPKALHFAPHVGGNLDRCGGQNGTLWGSKWALGRRALHFAPRWFHFDPQKAPCGGQFGCVATSSRLARPVSFAAKVSPLNLEAWALTSLLVVEPRGYH